MDPLNQPCFCSLPGIVTTEVGLTLPFCFFGDLFGGLLEEDIVIEVGPELDIDSCTSSSISCKDSAKDIANSFKQGRA